MITVQIDGKPISQLEEEMLPKFKEKHGRLNIGYKYLQVGNNLQLLPDQNSKTFILCSLEDNRELAQFLTAINDSLLELGAVSILGGRPQTSGNVQLQLVLSLAAQTDKLSINSVKFFHSKAGMTTTKELIKKITGGLDLLELCPDYTLASWWERLVSRYRQFLSQTQISTLVMEFSNPRLFTQEILQIIISSLTEHKLQTNAEDAAKIVESIIGITSDLRAEKEMAETTVHLVDSPEGEKGPQTSLSVDRALETCHKEGSDSVPADVSTEPVSPSTATITPEQTDGQPWDASSLSPAHKVTAGAPNQDRKTASSHHERPRSTGKKSRPQPNRRQTPKINPFYVPGNVSTLRFSRPQAANASTEKGKQSSFRNTAQQQTAASQPIVPRSTFQKTSTGDRQKWQLLAHQQIGPLQTRSTFRANGLEKKIYIGPAYERRQLSNTTNSPLSSLNLDAALKNHAIPRNRKTIGP